MMLIDGKHVAAELNRETAALVQQLHDRHHLQPALAVVLVGSDPASQVYVASKARTADQLGIRSVRRELPATASQAEVLEVVSQLNQDPTVDGILVQLPLPGALDDGLVIEMTDPAKDVDCFHPRNVGKLLIGDDDGFLPCTPYGVLVLLRHYGIDPAGKHAVIVGRSNIVGKPLAALLAQKKPGANATVTICHSNTKDLASHCRQADILIAAIGRPRFITAEMVAAGAVVIDVGTNRVDAPDRRSGSRLVGDVDFDAVSAKASAITPVPGGVGPMTIAMLMRNTVRACRRRHGVALDDSPLA